MIIGIQGYKGSGKDYVADVLADALGAAEKVAFADPIKNTVMSIFGLTSVEEYDEFKRIPHFVFGRWVQGRDIVRGIGMFARSANENFFTTQLAKTITENVNNSEHFLITDVRFDNEVELILHDLGGIVIEVQGGEPDGHVSEHLPCSDPMCILDNTQKSHAALVEQVEEFMISIGLK